MSANPSLVYGRIIQRQVSSLTKSRSFIWVFLFFFSHLYFPGSVISVHMFIFLPQVIPLQSRWAQLAIKKENMENSSARNLRDSAQRATLLVKTEIVFHVRREQIRNSCSLPQKCPIWIPPAWMPILLWDFLPIQIQCLLFQPLLEESSLPFAHYSLSPCPHHSCTVEHSHTQSFIPQTLAHSWLYFFRVSPCMLRCLNTSFSLALSVFIPPLHIHAPHYLQHPLLVLHHQ